MDGSPIERAYEFAKLHAATDNSFAELLTRQWFEAAWELCATHVGLVYPARQVTETVYPSQVDGTVRLSRRPDSEVRLFSNGVLVAVLPPNAPQLNGHNLPNPFARYGDDSLACMPPSLCCYCVLTAVYTVGQDRGACDPFSASFVMAVAMVFAHLCENRGDVKMGDQILTISGAKGFLAPQLTYVA